MANLIEQMNILKGLTDEHLQMELKSPTGGAAPFMVASEVARRKDMRQRYEAEAARRKPRTTVLDDLTAQSGGGMPPMGGAPGTDGLAPSSAPQAPGFATGGIIDYDSLATRYNDRLEGLGGDTKRAQALALLAAGAGIMGAGHSNTLQNVGLGINAGVSNYSDALKSIDSEELGLLRGITDIGQLQHADQLSQMDRDFRERQLAQEKDISDSRLKFDRTPAAVLTEEWYNDPNTTDAERKSFDEHQYNPNSLSNDQLIGAKTDAIYQDALKAAAIQTYDTPEATAEKMRKAQADAYKRIKAAYGAVAASQWAAGMGIADGDILLLNSPDGAATDGADPLQLGL